MPAQEEWSVYDPLTGPGLDPALWTPLRLPPGGGDHAAVDPATEITVRDGTVRLDLPRFTVADDASQPVDGAKHVLMSTATFDLPANEARTFAVDLAVQNVGGSPEDYRRAFAAFHVVDLETTRRSFSVCGTSTRVLALHEQVGMPTGEPTGAPFFHMVESPFADFDDDFTLRRTCEIELDRSTSSVSWRVDGHTVYALETTLVPQRVHVGFGLWTQLPLRAGRSRSVQGQGLRAAWTGFRYR